MTGKYPIHTGMQVRLFIQFTHYELKLDAVFRFFFVASCIICGRTAWIAINRKDTTTIFERTRLRKSLRGKMALGTLQKRIHPIASGV